MEPSSPGPEYRSLTMIYGELCKALPIDRLFPNLISCGVIDRNEQKEICRGNSTEPNRVQALLDIIMKDARINDCRRFNTFRKVLKTSSNCHFLSERLDQCLSENQSSSTREFVLPITVCIHGSSIQLLLLSPNIDGRINHRVILREVALQY